MKPATLFFSFILTLSFAYSFLPVPTQQPVTDIAFNHGVASGDPLSTKVVIWTRVTTSSVATPEVRWLIAENPDMSRSYQTGSVQTGAERDFTVKVDLRGLKPATTYYYQFECEGVKSPTGRTRTLPEENVDEVQLAVVSCSNYEWGYFNPLAALAKREDIDAVLHLGDYIYEYQVAGYGDTTIGRVHEPPYEIVSLQDYRTRYAQYRSTEGFQRVHQMHPFITVWDDHEITNNAYIDGAENHQENEGDYQVRKAVARQAYYEWMPVREAADLPLYRHFRFGQLVDLIMLDERLAGRTAPVDSGNDPNYQDVQRTILGVEQRDWFFERLKSSPTTWKVIGNQVIFSDLRFDLIFPDRPLNMDAWDGYPFEKKKIIDFLQTEQIENLVFVTGDTHCSWAFETPTSLEDYREQGVQSLVAVEFGTTSVSSGNYDEYTTMDTVQQAQNAYLQSNPHLKYVNLHDHGYLLLRLKPGEILAEWYYTETLRVPSDRERLGKRMKVGVGSKVLVEE